MISITNPNSNSNNNVSLFKDFLKNYLKMITKFDSHPKSKIKPLYNSSLTLNSSFPKNVKRSNFKGTRVLPKYSKLEFIGMFKKSVFFLTSESLKDQTRTKPFNNIKYLPKVKSRPKTQLKPHELLITALGTIVKKYN